MPAHSQSRLAGADDNRSRKSHDTRSLIRWPPLVDRDEDVRWIGYDVEYGRPLLRLRDQRLDVVVARISVDVELNADGAEAIAHVVVDAKYALNVHVGFKRGLDGMKLDAAPLGDGCNTRREAARETGEEDLDRSWSVVLGCEDLRVICLKRERLVAGLLGAKSEEAADRRAAMRAVHPLAGRAPLELRSLWSLLQGLARLEQRTHINSVVNLSRGRNAVRVSHCLSPVVGSLVTFGRLC